MRSQTILITVAWHSRSCTRLALQLGSLSQQRRCGNSTPKVPCMFPLTSLSEGHGVSNLTRAISYSLSEDRSTGRVEIRTSRWVCAPMEDRIAQSLKLSSEDTDFPVLVGVREPVETPEGMLVRVWLQVVWLQPFDLVADRGINAPELALWTGCSVFPHGTCSWPGNRISEIRGSALLRMPFRLRDPRLRSQVHTGGCVRNPPRRRQGPSE